MLLEWSFGVGFVEAASAYRSQSSDSEYNWAVVIIASKVHVDITRRKKEGRVHEAEMEKKGTQ